MTAKELIEMLKTVDPDTEVTVCAQDSDYYAFEYYEHPVDKKEIDISFGKFTICVG